MTEPDPTTSRSTALHAQVQEAIQGSVGAQAWHWPDALFDSLARRVFEHQYRSCAAYRSYCDGRSIQPDTLADWAAIPAVPTEVFKTVDLFAFEPDAASVTFMTSGTRLGRRGRHLLARSDTYQASLSLWLDRFLLEDGVPRRVLVLAPDASTDPASSLSFMLQWAVDERGGPGSRFLWTSEGPDLDTCDAELRAAEGEGMPILLLATASALHGLLEASSSTWALPEGSLVMETGGPKRSGMQFSRADFHETLGRRLGLAVSSVVSEYGMTELGSQGYSPSHLRRIDAEAAERWPQLDPDLHVFPPWCRVRSLHPDDLRVLPQGERGLLCFWDLSNVDSALCILTADEGVVTSTGVRLLGRSAAATPRGCSLAVEEILHGAGR